MHSKTIVGSTTFQLEWMLLKRIMISVGKAGEQRALRVSENVSDGCH